MFQGMKYVYAVYQEKSISKAAERLCISQPSLSANIKRTENKIGADLFDRGVKPLALTECGEKYIRAAEQIMQTEKEFENYVNDWSVLKTGNLVLGGSSLFSSWVLPALIGEFSRQYPGVKVELAEENTLTLQNLLQSRRIDIMVDNCDLDPLTFDRQVYREERLFLAVPQKMVSEKVIGKYAVTKEMIENYRPENEEIAPVPLSYFKDKPFIMLKPENDTRRRSMEILRANHIEPKILLELDQQLSSYHVACSGIGIAFISDTLICAVPVRPDMVYFRLPEKESVRKIRFYWKSGRYMTRAMEEFLRIAAEVGNKNP